MKAAADEDDEQQKTAFKDWGLKDKILLFVTAIALVAAMVMGTANIYANLMASGVTIFLTKPYLAVVIAQSPPLPIQFTGQVVQRLGLRHEVVETPEIHELGRATCLQLVEYGVKSEKRRNHSAIEDE